jgi:hypothetical protein
MYRRVAQAAVARGIGLKQNGLSERYDTWDDVTSASYLFNRYRFQSGVNLTYETGGLISRPSRSGDGHPLSVLNRAIIDGADNLFLYGADIGARHVHKYLPYADAMLSRSLVTTFYSRLGDFSLVNEFSPAPQPYRNQWLGLREFRADGADPLMTIKSGEPCAATRPGSPQITFDVDDRQQYHGMFGVVVSVQYLDEGRDAFELNCYNNVSRAWENLGRVQKTGTGAWKWAAFQKPDWCRTARNSGEDVHADIVINDLGDGIEHIAGLELDFVPAREWQRELLQSTEPSTLHTVITNSVSREIELPAGEPLHWIGVPLWVGSLERNSVLGRVIALTTGGEIIASEKTYDMPADIDWFEMPVISVPGCQRYRIELSQPKGSVGWYQGANGEFAFRAWRYAARTNVMTDLGASEPEELNPREEIFDADAPFFGVQLNLATDSLAAGPRPSPSKW